jgi:hypothetical protein
VTAAGPGRPPLDKGKNVLLYMPSCCYIFKSPGNAVKEIFIFMDYVRPPLKEFVELEG